MTATIKKLHQGLDNVDFIGTENITGSNRQHRSCRERGETSRRSPSEQPFSAEWGKEFRPFGAGRAYRYS